MREGLFVGDLDELDFIEDVERRFGIGFDERDYPSWLTLGDVHASLVRRLGNVEQAGGGCATQMAFYRLRRAAGMGGMQARPETSLAALGLGKPGATLRTLGRCGLEVPSAASGWLGTLASFGFAIAIIALIVSALSADPAAIRWSALVLLGSAILLWLAPRHYPAGIATLGELARAVALRNPMMLKAHGAGLRPGDLWESLRAVAVDHTGLAADNIAPDTSFIQRKAKPATT